MNRRPFFLFILATFWVTTILAQNYSRDDVLNLVYRPKDMIGSEDDENRIAGEKFLAANKFKPNIHVLPSGVQYKIIKAGTGRKPLSTSKVKVHYVGKTIDGNIFINSYTKGEPLVGNCDMFIKGWISALTNMPTGSIWEVYIPQDLAYGDREWSGIKPYSALIFKIELISIEEY